MTATGAEPLNYQWFIGSGDASAPIAGATAETHHAADLTATTLFWVRVSNLSGMDDSQTATITVAAPPEIVWYSTPGGEVEFMILSEPGLSLQVQESIDLVNWSILMNSIATGDGLRITPPGMPHEPLRFYRVVTP